MAYKPESLVAPFLTKTFSLVDDPATDSILKWCEDGRGFEIVDEEKMLDLLAENFKHRKMASFVRQLNVYDFRKLKSADGGLKYACDNFVRGKPELLRLMYRKDTAKKGAVAAAVVMGGANPPSPELEREVAALKRARDEDFDDIAMLREQHEEMVATLNGVLEVNRELRAEVLASRAENAEMQQTLGLILSMLNDLDQREEGLGSPDLLAELLRDEPAPPPRKRARFSPLGPLGPCLVMSPKLSSSPAFPEYAGLFAEPSGDFNDADQCLPMS